LVAAADKNHVKHRRNSQKKPRQGNCAAGIEHEFVFQGQTAIAVKKAQLSLPFHEGKNLWQGDWAGADGIDVDCRAGEDVVRGVVDHLGRRGSTEEPCQQQGQDEQGYLAN